MRWYVVTNICAGKKRRKLGFEVSKLQNYDDILVAKLVIQNNISLIVSENNSEIQTLHRRLLTAISICIRFHDVKLCQK